MMSPLLGCLLAGCRLMLPRKLHQPLAKLCPLLALQVLMPCQPQKGEIPSDLELVRR